MTSAWSARVLPSPIPLSLRRDRDGSTSMGGVTFLRVQLTAQDNLSSGDVACKVRNRMGLIILRHGKDRNHGDGAVLALLTSGSLIQEARSVYIYPG